MESTLAGPKVSLCIPAYKQPDYLRRALQSVLMQSYEDYEVIVTDDSPDDSVEIVLTDFLQNQKIKYYRNKERKGSPENWNEAISFATGEYIKILHHDDWFVDRDSLFKFVKLLDDNKAASFAFSSTYACGADRQIKYLHHPTESQLNKLKKDSLVLFIGNFIGSPSTTIFRNRAYVKFDKNLKWVVDIDFYICTLKQNPNFVYISEPLIFTTSGASHQVTSECSENKEIELYEWIYLYCKIREKYKANYKMLTSIKDLIRKYNVKSIAELVNCGIQAPIPLSIKALIALQKLIH